jgi:hypothetical protein
MTLLPIALTNFEEDQEALDVNSECLSQDLHTPFE